MININTLIPTQDFIRHPERIPGMVDFVQYGNIFTSESMRQWELTNPYRPPGPLNPPVMKIERFEDGKYFLRDGHHRAIALYKGDRHTLNAAEYRVRDWTYQDFLDIVFEYPNGKYMGWTTPFDPRTEIRHPDLVEFKNIVKNIFYTNGKEAAIAYILGNKHMYAKTRDLYSIKQLADLYTEKSRELFPCQT